MSFSGTLISSPQVGVYMLGNNINGSTITKWCSKNITNWQCLGKEKKEKILISTYLLQHDNLSQYGLFFYWS